MCWIGPVHSIDGCHEKHMARPTGLCDANSIFARALNDDYAQRGFLVIYLDGSATASRWKTRMLGRHGRGTERWL